MFTVKAVFPLAAVLILRPAAAQPPSPSELTPCPVLALEPAPCTERPNRGGALALVDGEAVTLADLDEPARKQVEGLGEAVRSARKTALKAEIDRTLLDLEARRRGTSPEKLYEAEIARKTADPSEADLRAQYAALPERIRSSRPFDEVKAFLLGKSRGEAMRSRFGDFTALLKSRFPVVPGEDVNGANLTSASVLARVKDRPLTASSCAARLDSGVYAIRQAAWETEKTALDGVIHRRLEKRVATQRGITPEALEKAEVTDRLQPPTEAEVAAYFEKYKRWFAGPLESVRPAVVESWTRERRETLAKAYVAMLEEGNPVRVLIAEPERPVLDIATGGSPARGAADAKVTLVEFGDFECPPCGVMWEMLHEALAPYGGSVRSVFRNFPLPFHRSAWKAAEAGAAAHEQGRFWDYADVLFHHQRDLDPASLKRFAQEAGLDSSRFGTAVDQGRFAAAVRRDILEGERYGVTTTPTFFVNGVQLPVSDYSVAGIRAAVDAALGAAGRRAPR